MKPALLVMAAGMGSRFGGLKQMEAMGPNGATLLDYSLYDALKAGFGSVIFVIRRDIEADFKKIIGRKWEGKTSVRYVYQELGMVPVGSKVPEGRVKPWGTGHALWVAQAAVKEPFAVINADDYYGPSGFKALAGFLSKIKDLDEPRYAMVGFLLSKTLSDHGKVSRGVCHVLKSGFLASVTEHPHVEKAGSKIFSQDAKGKRRALSGKEIVSLNQWVFTPGFFKALEKDWAAFFEKSGTELKSEFQLPGVVDRLIQKKKATVKVLPSKDNWFGVTYIEDKELVKQKVQALVAKGLYPELL
jgi:UTP-glucose-1-phosphate uridylyltransferase